MGLEIFDNYECEGQMNIYDLFEVEVPEGLFAVSKIFARAKKQMNLAEYKAFTYALTNIRFKEENSTKIILDKKTLAKIVGVNSDPDHLSEDLKRSIGQLPMHSYMEFEDKDNDFYENGFIVTKIRMYKNKVCLYFDEDYMKLFSLLKDGSYITMWSGDIFSMTSDRSVEFYEELRLNTDSRDKINTASLGVKYFKELFNIPKDGKGSYMREKGGFDRTNFEKYVIDPLCEDLSKCKMITLILQENGKYYQKLKKNGRVIGYHFNWTYTSHPKASVLTDDQKKAIEHKANGTYKSKEDFKQENKSKKNSFNNFPQRDGDKRYWVLKEKVLLGKALTPEEREEYEILNKKANESAQ